MKINALENVNLFFSPKLIFPLYYFYKNLPLPELMGCLFRLILFWLLKFIQVCLHKSLIAVLTCH